VITAGIDMGAKTIKVVVLRDGGPVGRAARNAGFDAAPAAREALTEALSEAGVARTALERVCSTGAGREESPDRDRTMTDVSCAARGAVHLFPEVRTVIDVGAEEARAIRCDERGRVLDFAVNEKCAAGAGAFTEAIARALEIPVEELGPLSLRSTRSIPMSAQCAVFAESEAVSMIHANVAREDLARAVHEAMASRILAMLRRVGGAPPLALVGGLARNVGFVDALGRALRQGSFRIPDGPEFCCALGAALAAAQG
jgi:benzoyl-CoA reductase subunit D